MLDIVEKLIDDDGYKNNLLESLHLEAQKTKETINKGLTPDEYEKFSKYSIAIETSINVLNNIQPHEYTTES